MKRGLHPELAPDALHGRQRDLAHLSCTLATAPVRGAVPGLGSDVNPALAVGPKQHVRRARRASAALPLRLRITASNWPRSSAVNSLLYVPSTMGINSQPQSQWTGIFQRTTRRISPTAEW